MTRARMLLASALGAAAIAAGCDNSPFGPPAFHAQRADKGDPPSKLFSEPQPLASPASAPAAGQKADPTDPKASAVGQQVNEYLSNLEKQNNPSPAGTTVTPGQSDTAAVAGSREPTTRPAASPPRGPTSRPAPATTIERVVPAPKPPALASASRPAAVTNAVMAGPTPPTTRQPQASSGSREPRVQLIDVRPAAKSTSPGTSSQSPPSPNKAAAGTGGGPVPADMAAMIRQLEESVARHPQHLDDQLRLRLLYLVTGQDEKAVAPLRIGDPMQAEFITALLKTLRNSRNMLVDPADKDPSSLAAVEELHRLLGQQLPVSIPRIALVTRINSFGDYQAISPPRLPAGQPIHVFLYTEVYNFRTETTDEGKLRTLLAQKVEIFDSTGKIVWQRSEPSIVDKVVTPRRDFFIPFPINLPDALPAGDYILKVTVEDKIGATADQKKLTFSVGQ